MQTDQKAAGKEGGNGRARKETKKKKESQAAELRAQGRPKIEGDVAWGRRKKGKPGPTKKGGREKKHLKKKDFPPEAKGGKPTEEKN